MCLCGHCRSFVESVLQGTMSELLNRGSFETLAKAVRKEEDKRTQLEQTIKRSDVCVYVCVCVGVCAGRPPHGTNEADVFIIAILGGNLFAIYRGEKTYVHFMRERNFNFSTG